MVFYLQKQEKSAEIYDIYAVFNVLVSNVSLKIKRNYSILLKPIVTPDISEFDALMKESQKWAKSVGMTEDDIDDAIKAVRKRRKA